MDQKQDTDLLNF